MATEDKKVPDDLQVTAEDVDLLPSLRPEARRAKVWEFRIKGVSVASIARVFGVSESTIYEDLRLIGEKFRDQLLQMDGVAVLADNLRWLDEMERIALYEVNQAETTVVKTIDPQTGQVKEERIADPNRGRFFQSAVKVRELKLKLLLDSGVLPKSRTELFEKLGSYEEKKEEVVEERTEEEIRSSIDRLMKHGRLMPPAQEKKDE